MLSGVNKDWRNKMKKPEDKGIKIGLYLILFSIMIQPVAAWGDIYHIALTSDLKDVREPIRDHPYYAKGGSIGPDLFFFYPGKEYLSDFAHETDSLQKKMITLSTNDQQKAYVYGWGSHYGSDLVSLIYIDQKISQYPFPSHTEVEIGVDASVGHTDLKSYLPYGLLQEGYEDTFGIRPSKLTILTAALTQKTSIYLEMALIDMGVFNNLKRICSDNSDYYEESIKVSIDAIDDIDENSEEILTIMIASPSIAGDVKKGKHHDIDQDILATSNDLLNKKIIEVSIKDDAKNKIFHIGDIKVNDEKALNEAIKKLAEKKKVDR